MPYVQLMISVRTFQITLLLRLPHQKTPDEATSSHQTTLPSMFEKKMTQSGFDDLISVYLSRCALPFNHVESSGFKEFVTKLAPGYRIKTHHAYALRCRRITTLLKQKLV